MILNFFANLILTTAFLQLFPVDVGDVQRLALFPEAKDRSLSAYDILSLPQPHVLEANTTGPTKIKPNSLGVVTSAVSALVVDRKTKQILFEKNIDVPRSIGSITKLMTALVFLKTNPDLNAPAQLESLDFRQGGVQHLPFNELVTVKDLLYASLISSDNSATAAIMRLSGMSNGDFVARMNETAAEFGMEHTTFVDAAGLSQKNTSIVMDLVKMLDVVANNETIKDATEHSEFLIIGSSGKKYLLKSTDQLLKTFINQNPYHIIAGKTGFLPEAGYGLGTVLSRDGSGDIIIVVLGAETNADRFQDMKSLAVWTFNTFKWSMDITLSYDTYTH